MLTKAMMTIMMMSCLAEKIKISLKNKSMVFQITRVIMN